jgi:hypothetical protein
VAWRRLAAYEIPTCDFAYRQQSDCGLLGFVARHRRTKKR